MYVELTDISDVNQINILQFVNCFDTVYFNQDVSEKYVRDIYLRSKIFHKANIPRSTASHLIKTKQDEIEMKLGVHKKNLIGISTTECETKLKSRLLKLKPKTKKIKLGNRLVLEREWANKVKKEMDKIFDKMEGR